MTSQRTQPGGTTWTTRALLRWLIDAFTKAGLDSPRLMAEMLAASALGCERMGLYTHADRVASEEERARLRGLAARALKHEPVQYLVGEAWFYSLPFRCDRRALIPRPSTETVVDEALRFVRETPGFGGKRGEGATLGDVCTGSGAVAVALLRHLPGARAAASDISADALTLARENAERHGVADRLDLLEGDLLAPIAGHPIVAGGLHVLTANPPYIPDEEWAAVALNVKGYEPEIALRGGPGGMRLVAPLLADGPALLRPGGLLLVEIAMSSAEAALSAARENPMLEGARIVNDSDGLPRVVWARRG